ncbi:MAG: sigma-54 interaction domain-containing protein [Candidatus Binatia bacterium]
MNRAAPPILSPEPLPKVGFARIPKLLIVEEKGEIKRLLKDRFSAGICLDALPLPDGLPDRLRGTTYDMLIWVAENSRLHKSKLQDVFEQFSTNSPQTQILVISDQEPDPVRFARKGGNYQYIPEPIDGDNLCNLIKVALEKHPLSQSMLAYPEVRVLAEFEGMIGISLPMREVFQQIMEASSVDIPVLVTGETGTGKELVAAAIHNRSKRKSKPYIPVNTGAIAPELIASELFGHEKGAYTGAVDRRQGFFEQADGGTIFLDEISTMDEKTQVGLLRILETKTFRRVRGEKDIHTDVRVIAATNEDLEEAIKKRRFREDLYYRLDVFQVHLPPLRDRPGGVTLLTNHFVVVFNSLYQKNVKAVSPEAYRCLRRYSWPGNVRELKNVIQRAVLMAKEQELTLDFIPSRIREAAEPNLGSVIPQFPIRPGMTLQDVEKEFIAMTLATTRGNKKEAALQLGISRRALYNKLSKYGLR